MDFESNNIGMQIIINFPYVYFNIMFCYFLVFKLVFTNQILHLFVIYNDFLRCFFCNIYIFE